MQYLIQPHKTICGYKFQLATSTFSHTMWKTSFWSLTVVEESVIFYAYFQYWSIPKYPRESPLDCSSDTASCFLFRGRTSVDLLVWAQENILWWVPSTPQQCASPSWDCFTPLNFLKNWNFILTLPNSNWPISGSASLGQVKILSFSPALPLFKKFFWLCF